MESLEKARVRAGPEGGASQGPSPADERLSAIASALPIALIVVDPSGIVQSLNGRAEAMFGCRGNDVAGQPLSDLLGSSEQEVAGWLTGTDAGEHAALLETVITAHRRNGSIFPVALSVASQGDERLLFLRDLTSRQDAEHRLHELQREIGRLSGLAAVGTLAATFAHELNPLLTAAVNYLDAADALIEPLDPGTARLRDALGHAADSLYRAGQVVHHLRDAAAPGQVEHRIESLPQLVEEVSGLALVDSGGLGVDIHVRLDRSAEKVVADGLQVQQVLLNLIRNSLEAMGSSSTRELVITTQREADGYVRLTVSDSGPGLGEEVTARLFQPFATTKTDRLGMGLAVCRDIVEAHGGRIWTEPSSLGGTAFHFTLVEADGSIERPH
jgi:two-component system sensor kinase FixL